MIDITAPPLTESDIQKGITDLLKTLGFTVYHTRFAIGSDSGFPDVFACDEDGLIIVVECKGPKGHIRSGQAEWIGRFNKVPGCVFSEIVGPRRGMCWEGYDDALALIQRRVEEVRTESGESHKESQT